MQKDDETTASEFDKLLQANSIKLSCSTILRCRRQLGWTYHGAAYCQLIWESNKLKRFIVHEESEKMIHNVIWTDETNQGTCMYLYIVIQPAVAALTLVSWVQISPECSTVFRRKNLSQICFCLRLLCCFVLCECLSCPVQYMCMGVHVCLHAAHSCCTNPVPQA